MKYLQAKHCGDDTEDIVMKMKILYNETPSEAREEKMKELGCIYNQQQKSLHSFDPILEYYMAIWLLYNGYRSENNKAHVMTQARLQVSV